MVGGVGVGKDLRRRALREPLLGALKSDYLRPFVDLVRSDTSLCMELRGDYVNIYYRGGNLVKIALQGSTDTAVAAFDRNYFRVRGTVAIPEVVDSLPRRLGGREDVRQWLNAAPTLKQAMDRRFGEGPKDEREFQQRILRDNNFGTVARSTDYFICDIEYQNPVGRFDMIAVHWPSTSADRKKNRDRDLAFIEVKHGDSALEGKAGLHEHIKGVNKFAADSRKLDLLKNDMVELFNHKRTLDLVDCGKNLQSFSVRKPKLILALVNHDPASSKLRRLLDECPESPHVELCVVTASLLGYGLYDQGTHAVPEARKRFSDYI